ncbi:MAG: hypothetical protein QM723_37605 [Myxococcaceae bacterium]
MRIAAALAVVLTACTSAKPCSACDCGHPGIFRLDVLLPPQSLGSFAQSDEPLSNATLTYGDFGDGRSSTVVGPTADGGTITVLTNHGVGLNPSLKPSAVSWYAEDESNYQSTGAAFSFADRGAQLIVHDGAKSSHEGPVLEPVSSYTPNPDAGTVTVTIDGQSLSGELHTPVTFSRRGATWCFTADEATYQVTALSHWAVFQLDALAEQ